MPIVLNYLKEHKDKFALLCWDTSERKKNIYKLLTKSNLGNIWNAKNKDKLENQELEVENNLRQENLWITVSLLAKRKKWINKKWYSLTNSWANISKIREMTVWINQ